MPLFEYICLECNDKFEELVSSADKSVNCPKCGSEKTIKQFSTFASNAVKTDSCGTCKPTSGFS
ncbi:MAG: zinc ribbon domain-containing protein [Candidatus Zixiibacteriota bacterium]|nr:MAG: zinc ribbon domain-containing protein [candidate division Zixibacteria bacterium]HDL02688.1 zinc ribbon domain-containing protein [candidate division Zixibacteria bacterium]